MVIFIRVSGLKEAENFVIRLPKELNKEIMSKSWQFMTLVEKYAKKNAPVETGFLKDQIRIYKEGNNKIVVDTGEAYYAGYQEFGFKAHAIPVEYMKQHSRLSPNIPGMKVEEPTAFKWVSSHKPFMIPALQAGLVKLPNMLKDGVQNAIKKSH